MTTEYERTSEYERTTEDEAPTGGNPPAGGTGGWRGPESASGYAEAVAEARKAGAAGPAEGFIERMVERIGGRASVGAVFGDPIQRDGITIIPVAKVHWGFGGGAGSGAIPVGPGKPGEGSPFSDSADIEAAGTGTGTGMGTGSGGGGAASAEPLGYLEIGPDGATFHPITQARPSAGFMLAAGVAAALVLRSIARLVRR
jgi:uncharacterized spore protein YtfJ